MIVDVLYDMLLSACVAPPLRWLWSRYSVRVQTWLRDVIDYDEGSS